MMRRVLLVFLFAGLCACMGSAQTVLYFSDFESDDGGWTSGGFGDWEYGLYDAGTYIGPDSAPPAAFSGENLWGTILADNYSDSGENSTLTQTFDLTGFATASLSWANWAEVFFDFDTAELRVNGNVEYERDTSAAPTDWEVETVDLTPYVGGMATIEYDLFATTVVSRAGWYVDDVKIEGRLVPEPGTMGLLGMAMLGVVALTRRR